MLMQEKISGSDTLLKLYVAIDEDLKVLHPHLHAKRLPRDPRDVYLLTTTCKTMRHLASQFQVACLRLRHRRRRSCF